MVQFADDPAVRHRIVFLPDYDMAMAARPVPGLRRVAEQPAAPAGGLRHLGHEGRAERRAQPVRSWTAGGTSGTTARTAGRSRPPTASPTRTAATTSRRAALYELHRDAVAPRFYDRDADGAAGALDRAWCGTRCARSARRCWPAGWCRTTCTQLYVPGRASGRALDGDRAARRGARLAAWKHRVAKEWGAVRVDHVEAGGVGRRPGARATRCSCGVFVLARCARAGGRRGAGAARAGRRRRPAGRADGHPAGGDRAVRRRPLALRRRAAAGRAGSFGYTVRVLPSEPHLASPAEMNLVALPQTPGAMTDGDLR